MISDRTTQERAALLGSYLQRLDAGEALDTVKNDFAAAFDQVSSAEIADAEQALIASGTTVEKIQQLCDVHAVLFEGAVAPASPEEAPGHPVQVMLEENRQYELQVAAALRAALPYVEDGAPVDEAARAQVKQALEAMSAFIVHYKRKEELLFPHLERYGVTGPSKVMWGKDDEIRESLKQAQAAFDTNKGLAAALRALLDGADGMVNKEEQILIPLALDKLNAANWTQIAEESDEFGFALIAHPPLWRAPALELAALKLEELKTRTAEHTTLDNSPAQASSSTHQASNTQDKSVVTTSTATHTATTEAAEVVNQAVTLSTGSLTPEQLEGIFSVLPLDITFVDANDKTRYFSHGDTRAFPRPMSCLGRDVYACHPPKSQEMVRGLIESFRAGTQDVASFWIHKGEKFLYIRYFAVRDKDGTYLGALETTQDITGIQALEGENRRGSDERRARGEA